MKDLKKCPFCGKSAYLKTWHSEKKNKFYAAISCNVCGASTKPWASDSKDIGAEDAAAHLKQLWNNRVPGECDA